jgi:hypothetical protein
LPSTSVPIDLSSTTLTPPPPSIQTSISILETDVANFKPIETYYDEIKITWLECEVPQDYYHNWRFAAKCLKMELPSWDEKDKQRLGERFKVAPSELEDIRLVIGEDVYETRHKGSNYELTENGESIASAISVFSSFDPNQSLLDVNGKTAWELAGLNSDQSAQNAIVIYDGINLRDKYALEGAYIPYEINDKLIFVAKKNREFFVMYDQQQIGPVFSEISIGYCCGPKAYSIQRAGDQYWFWGMREEKYYVVALYGE